MKRLHWLTRAVPTVAAVFIAGSLCGVVLAARPLVYPKPSGCAPNVGGFGYFEQRWRVWPGDDKLIERINPRAVGGERIPTPAGHEEVPPPKALTPPAPPTRAQPAPAPESEPVPLPPPGGVTPQEGLLLPPGQPQQAPAPREETPLLPPPSKEGSPTPMPGEGVPGLQPDLPAEPTAPQSKPDGKPAKPADAPARQKATTRPSSPLLPPELTPERRPAMVGDSPAARRKSPERIIVPTGGLEPERNTVLPGVFRADANLAPLSRRTERVAPVAYVEEETPSIGTVRFGSSPYDTRAGREPPAVHPKVVAPMVAIEGFCPVELLRNGRWVQGDTRWTVVYKGLIYRLSGAKQRQEFAASPEAFAPVNGGNDPVVSIEQHRSVPGQSAYCATYGGRLYMFSSDTTLSRFNSDPQRYAE
ncbi:MAG: hypothetical protein LLG00_05205 [Planctomycetaceae bacterium]|nr:hypothetical protein [Planctomycetaceae bacterium]